MDTEDHSNADSHPIIPRIFNISKIKKENLLLMRNKIPKVFSIQKYRHSTQPKISLRTRSEYAETPIKSVCGSIFKIDRFKEPRKRPAARPIICSKIQQRICNEYPENFRFKISKVYNKKERDTCLDFSRNPLISTHDVHSIESKRSSMLPSDNFTPTVLSGLMSDTEQISLDNLSESGDSSLVEEAAERIPQMSDLFMLNKEQNDELERELANYDLPEVPYQEITHLQPCLEKIQKQLEHESIDSYHDEELNEACLGNLNSACDNPQNKPHLRPRLMSGMDEFNALEVNENNSFLLGNERETQHFETFIADKLFS